MLLYQARLGLRIKQNCIIPKRYFFEKLHKKLENHIHQLEKHTNERKKQSNESIKKIICVASGKGGVGKSTIAVNLALAFDQLGLKVELINFLFKFVIRQDYWIVTFLDHQYLL